MARYGQRPENALKRATEFIEVGKPARALDTLYEVFKNKKWVFSWSESVLEPIMFKYLELCVELKKSHIAKEGLFQYRNLFQSVNVGSLENVIRFYLRTAEERTEQAREQSQQAVVDIDDLDNLATPESILLSAVSGEDAQDRSDRTILTPWVKFLWESYCQCLELLRTNTHVETLYHDIARMAFQFCLKYSRKTEFRKLCDKLRKHLEDIQKLTPQVANVSISKPETQQLNQDTRLVQLDSAIQMELWQEAYKAIEDIHGLMNLAKKSPVPKTMANYYQKLALVFWKAGNYLFHAAALFKLFQLSKEMKKNITNEELQKMACRVLIATLSIPLPSAHPEFDRFIETDKSPLEKAQRLAVLLGLFQPPTRQSLLKDLVRMNVITLASPQLQDLYQWLEVEYSLQLCERIYSIVEIIKIDENYAPLIQYIPALQDVTLIRLIRQVSQVYQTIEFGRLLQLAKFSDKHHIERLLVDCVRHNDMQIQIDHRSNCIHFGMDLSQSQREDRGEGPTLQSMPSEQIRNQLINMATVLRQALTVIEPQKHKADREKLKSQLVQLYHETKIREHHEVLARRQIIEDRKEYLERMNTVREEEEARRQEEYQRQQIIAEQKRLNQEREERERKRQENEIQQIKDRHLKEKMQQISQTTHGQRILKKLEEDDIRKMDADEIAAREVEELQKERRELQQKLKSQEKKVDYFERAKRLEEIPLLQRAFEDRKKQDLMFWEQQEKERIEQLVEERHQAVQTRERMLRMLSEKDIFTANLQNERKAEFKARLEEYKAEMNRERKRLMEDRKIQRKEERRAMWLYEKEEEAEQRRREEEEAIMEAQRRKREEEEAAEKLRKQQEHEEYLRKKEALDRQAEKQREREREIEERRKAELASSMTSGRGGDGGKSWRSQGAYASERGGGGSESPITRRPAAESGGGSDWRRHDSSAPAATGDPPRKPEPWRPNLDRSKGPDLDRSKGPDSEVKRSTGDSWRNRAMDRDDDREGDRFKDAPSRGSRDDRDRRDDRERRETRDRGFRDDRDRGGRDDRRDDRGFGRSDRAPREDRDRGFGREDRPPRDDRDRGFRDERGPRDMRGARDDGDRRSNRDDRGMSYRDRDEKPSRNVGWRTPMQRNEEPAPAREERPPKDWSTQDAEEPVSQDNPVQAEEDDGSWEKVKRK